MKLETMSRRDALLKLVALEPIAEVQAIHVCGWPMCELRELVRELVAERSLEVLRIGANQFAGGGITVYRLGRNAGPELREFAARAAGALDQDRSARGRLAGAGEDLGARPRSSVSRAIWRAAEGAGSRSKAKHRSTPK